jgi:hypothetical protein
MSKLPRTVSLLLIAACSSALAVPSSTALAADPQVLRAVGPSALDALLARYDQLAPGPERDELARQIDRVAAQKHATVSRMFWYTDLASARAAARTAGKPILELRLLGRLDEELSCANSRIFRETLYANTALSAWLRQHFILMWSTERPVPKVTIDFGDGRTIHTTTTGNSAHFIRDARGDVVDVLPGVYAPGPFKAELEKTLALIETLDAKNPARRIAQVKAWHVERGAETRVAWRRITQTPFGRRVAAVMKNPPVTSAVARAQMVTVSKAYVEVPQLAGFGADPGSIAEDETAAWAMIGMRTWNLGGKPTLDPASKALVIALHQAGPITSTPAEVDALIPRFEQHLVADSALNELKLRTKVHAYLADRQAEFGALDRYLYAEVFGTPITDRWLGLLPRTDVTGLAGDGAAMP